LPRIGAGSDLVRFARKRVARGICSQNGIVEPVSVDNK
jgi:hypothetical protein